MTFSLSTKKVRLILRLNSGHKQPVDGDLIVVYVRMNLKVGRRREMKFKDLFGGDKEPAVKAEAETKTEPAVKAKAETKWKPKVKGKAAAKRAKRKKRF
jgi:uncharacterized protein YceH (UPF0502 family)